MFIIVSLFGHHGERIALKSRFGKYVMAGKDGKGNANSNIAETLETFIIEELGGNRIAFKTTEGNYLVADEKDKEVHADRRSMCNWAIFEVDVQEGGSVCLKTAHGYYMVAENDGRLKATGTTADNGGKFYPELIGTLINDKGEPIIK